MKRLLHLVLLLLLAAACSSNKKYERPLDAWVVRSVLDQHPRVLSAALHPTLWVAYNTQTGGLFKAWSGGIHFDGPVYTAAHGPQPTTKGAVYVEEPATILWRVSNNGADSIPQIIYKGHRFTPQNQVVVQFELVAGKARVRVAETPEFMAGSEGKIGFKRSFAVEGLENDQTLQLKVHFSSLSTLEDIEAGQNFRIVRSERRDISGKNMFSGEGLLTLENGENNITIDFSALPAEQPASAKLSGEEAVQSLMAKSDCNTCHNRDVKTVGPAYIEIARRYQNTTKQQEELAEKVIKGGAGNWGDVPMTAHPTLAKEDALTMVKYVLALDADEEKTAEHDELMPRPPYEVRFEPIDPSTTNLKGEQQGLAVNVYQFAELVSDFPELNDEMLPIATGRINALHADENDFGQLKNNFVVHATGFITAPSTQNVVFRLVSDDGSRLFVDDKLIVDNGGNHGLDPRDGEMILKAGKHKIRVEYFQGSGGKGLSLQWRPYKSKAFSVVPQEMLTFSTKDLRKTTQAPLAVKKDLIPGDKSALVDVHPSFTLSQARPFHFQPKVGGMDFLSDGRMVVSTWDSLGAVYVIEGLGQSDTAAIKVKRIAFGLAEPLGLKVVNDEIYVLQKQELTRLVDNDSDGLIDEYKTICNGWRVSANFHEFAFGLLYKDGHFYATLATAINPGGASTKPQIPDRGKAVKISKETGAFEFVATGLRTPNGIGFGVDNEIFIADNQGDWLPASKIVHLQEGAWYGSRSVDFEGTANATEYLPVVWLPQDEIGNSPSQPGPLNIGPYKNQMIHGDVTHGGLKRVFAEKVNGKYQGVVFRFTQGLEAGINRIAWGPDSTLYVGGIGSTGNWGHYGKLSHGLQRLSYNGKSTFEMLAVRARPDGLEIEFTQPLAKNSGERKEDYEISQWRYVPTENYGGPKVGEHELVVSDLKISDDRRKVFVGLKGMKAGHVLYIHLKKTGFTTDEAATLWSTEAWYTMNSLPIQNF